MTAPKGDAARILLIGLDSVDVGYVRAHLASLPNLRRLFTEGIVRELASPADVMSASVWPTFYTGTPPGEHGQYFPMQWDPAGMRLRHVASDWLDCEPFWRPLAREGLPVTSLDVQCVFPSRTPAGVEIVNWGVEAFGGFHCNRPEVGRDVVRRFGTNVLGPDVPVDKSRRRLGQIRATLLAGARRRGELTRWLLAETPWRLFVTVFTECHRAGHYFWQNTAAPDAGDWADALLEVHRAVDREVGALLAAVDPRNTSVIVFSLLGMAPNRSQMHFVPAVIDRLNAQFQATDMPPQPTRPPRRPFVRALRESLPARLQERIALAVPEWARDWVTARAYAHARDWPRMPAFAMPTGGEGYVRLNVAGREARGCLPRDGAGYRDAIREAFLSLRVVETGEPLVEDVVVPAERFPGPRSSHLPDLAIAWRPDAPATAVHAPRLGTFRGRLQTGRGGNHRAAAFAAILGPARSAPRAASLATIIDLADLARSLAVPPR